MKASLELEFGEEDGMEMATGEVWSELTWEWVDEGEERKKEKRPEEDDEERGKAVAVACVRPAVWEMVRV
jgi:hypothetical protein